MVATGQREASVVTPANFPPSTRRSERIVIFVSFVVARLVPPFLTFFLQVLDTFGVQLAHLILNSVVILAIFAHFCEMFVGVPPSVALFQHFFVLRATGKKKGSAEVEDWRQDWVYVNVSPHDCLALPQMVVEPHRPIWEATPAEDERLRLVLNHIDNLRRAGLTSLMVVADYLRRHLAPLWERARFAWMYTGSGDLTRIHIGLDGDLDEGALTTLLKVVTSVDDLARAVLP